jgi:hypothetical protein
VINEDSIVFDDDVVEINTMEDPSIHTNSMTKKKAQKKRRKSLFGFAISKSAILKCAI